MSSSRQKKVHYERGTKGGHKHGHSRDSGFGSSSTSGASLATEEPFNYQQIEDQKYVPSAVHEALNAANEHIARLEASNAKLDQLLTDSNKGNRLLRREKADLLNEVYDLRNNLHDEKQLNELLKREFGPRMRGGPSSREERPSPPREPRPYRRSNVDSGRIREDERHQGRHRENERRVPPTTPQPPPNPTSTRPRSYVGTTPYSTVPVADPFPNDGRYHPYPL